MLRIGFQQFQIAWCPWQQMFRQQLLDQPALTFFGQPRHHHQQSTNMIFRLIAIVLSFYAVGP
ncbi:hypothetical protein D3C72_2030940 [compost metagenome]